MKNIMRTISGIIVIACGLGFILFGGSLFIAQQSWLMAGGLLVFGGLGYGVADLGYAIIRGRGVKQTLLFLSFIGMRAP